MPKVSVIIPTYNRAEFIAEAIQSVLDQTFTDFEVIVVDDGSTDNTEQVVSIFKDTRLKYIYQENQGLPAARNAGIQASSGEYIAFLDSDDIFMENALERGIQPLDEYPEVAFSYSQNYSIDEKGQVIGLEKKGQKLSRVREGKELIREFLIHGHHVGVCATMVRRSRLFEVNLFDLTYRVGSADFDLLVRLAKRYAAAYIGEPTGKVRSHSYSMTNTRDLAEREKTNGRIFEYIFNDPELGELFSHLRPETYFRLYLRFTAVACGRKDMKTARSYLLKALKIYPKGFFKGLWLPWIVQFGKTWMPTPILDLFRKAKRFFRA